MVTRDGIEPPTPAFSGLKSANVNLLTAFDLHSFTTPFSCDYWDQFGTDRLACAQGCVIAVTVVRACGQQSWPMAPA